MLSPSRVIASRVSVVLLAIVLLTVIPAWPQTDTARLQGTIVDSTGGVVPGATVTVTSLATNRALNVESDAATGSFSFPALPPGRYKVEVSKAGFKALNQEVILQVSQVANVTLTLEAGAVSEVVNVTGDAALVDSASSDIGQTVQGRQITELPLNGRNFTQLATLLPGVTRGIPDSSATGANGSAETFRYGNTGGAALSVNGLRPQSNNFMLDGLDNNESLVNTIVFFSPAEAMEEFRVQTSVAPAQFGRAGGAIVNSSIKSGTNDIHGSVFEFLRNSQLDARPTFAPSRSPFKRNQFGATLGAPIVKDKVFIFGDYQGLRQSLPLSTDFASVPTAKMRTGDFSELLNTSVSGLPSTYVIKDLTTGLPFSGNVIPGNKINPVGQKYLNAYPLPNIAGKVQQNYAVQRQQIQSFNDFDIRMDWIASTKDQLFGRVSYAQDPSTTTSRLPALPAGFGSGLNFNHARGLAVGETHTFTPTALNEFRMGFTRVFFGYTPPFQDTPISANLGIPNANTSSLLGGGALIGGFNGQLEYTGDFGPYLVPENTYQYADTMTWIKNKHTFKFGASIIRRQVNLYRPNRGKGYFFLFGNGNGPGSTGYEVADMLAGFINEYTIGPPFGMVGTRNWETGYYVQDDFKVNRKLTLNLGLRYDYYSWPTEVGGRQANFDITTGKIVKASGDGDPLINADKNNFAPRVGFAYDLTGEGKTVVRGGFGMFYFLERGGIDNQLAQNPPFSGFSSFTYAQGYRITLSGQGPLNSSNPVATTGPLPSGDTSGLDLNNPKNVTVFSALKNNRNSYVEEWNVQVQRDLGHGSVFSIAYVGTQGKKLMSYYNLNRQFFNTPNGTKLFPNLGDVNVLASRGNSAYNGLQTMLERRFSSGLQFRASYTWSKVIDDGQGPLDNTQPQDVFNLRGERGLSRMDSRNRFVFSGLYQIPFGRGKQYGHSMSRAADLIAGGWQLNTIITFQSGFPFGLTTNANPSDVRPDVLGPVATYAGNPNHYFDTSKFAMPPKRADGVLVRPGTFGRDVLIGPGTNNVDLSLFKDFHVTERFTTQFRAEAYNIANHPQFSNPSGGGIDITSGDFGKIRGTRLGSERQIQFALRVSF